MDFTLFFFKLLGALTSYVRTQLHTRADRVLECIGAAEKSGDAASGTRTRVGTRTPLSSGTPRATPRLVRDGTRAGECHGHGFSAVAPSRHVVPSRSISTVS